MRIKNKTYYSWVNMKTRCNNDYSLDYARYGMRGVKVCERWSFYDNFLADMGEKPEGLTLERKNNAEGYCKENCKWATRAEQAQNRRPLQISTEQRIDGTSGVRGVSPCNGNRWEAAGQTKGIKQHLYSGPSFEAACLARKVWEVKQRGGI